MNKRNDPTEFNKAREQRIGIVTVLTAGLLSSNPHYLNATSVERKRILGEVSSWANDILATVG